ncbi:Uncharacterised protein [Serratia quinivorans]|jgi:hypothetical protein|nr:Uncharacterised protein [Serratia quinivorans]SPZ61190.1 Uncharacterised protein [Serratia quinivorans]VEI73375.1 Uncharacterised protein [Serratia quinivorans]
MNGPLTNNLQMTRIAKLFARLKIYIINHYRYYLERN